ncbi:MAG: GNAT family N-acetyltransferase [Sphingobacteriaceae bacterium]|jgi:N-acetylglutamate synthase-like GNAT family acetyltransferase
MDFQIQACTPHFFESVKSLIAEFELDNRALEADQFLIATLNNKLIGFGRIREYENCAEMCSMGVVDEYRNKGVAKALTKALIQKTSKPLYLVCIIPQFFENFNFTITASYPPELKNKLDYCTGELVVEETYVVMKLQ